MVQVTFQGEKGAYSEEALLIYFQARGMRGTEPVPCRTFDDAVRAVESGDAHYTFLPIENTLEGTVDEAVDVMLASDLYIVGEMRHKIDHCLIGHKGASSDTVRRVHSHPYALRQCQDFLRARGFEAYPANDTAGAVREVKARGDVMEAAIAGRNAADVYGMEVLERGVQSREHNSTRFVALSRSEYKRKKGSKDEFLTSLVFGCRHSPGALHEVLGAFADRGINLVKLESRPRPERPWTYSFLVDLEGHHEDPEVAGALGEIIHKTTHLQVLGSYPTWDSVRSTQERSA